MVEDHGIVNGIVHGIVNGIAECHAISPVLNCLPTSIPLSRPLSDENRWTNDGRGDKENENRWTKKPTVGERGASQVGLFGEKLTGLPKVYQYH